MTKYILDTSAWIEYFEGTKEGLKVKNIVEDPFNEIFIDGNVLAEMISKIKRKGNDPESEYACIKSYTKYIMPTMEEFYHTGETHAELKRESKDISYTDSLLIVLSKTRELKLISKDFHLKKFSAVFLGK